jgi:uncharacterized protein YrrD
MVIDAKNLLDMRVIATDTGRQLGVVDELLFEPGRHVLLGLLLKTEGDRPQLLVTRANVQSFGRDAITVSVESAAEVLDANEHARQLGISGGHLLKIDVLTQNGDKIGSIDRVLLNEDGTINCYRASSGFLGMGAKQDLSPEDVVAASKDSFVVSSATVGER